MARIFTCGFETGHILSDGLDAASTPTYITSSPIRSGLRSILGEARASFTGTLSSDHFLRVFMQTPGYPASQQSIVRLQDSSAFALASIRMGTDGSLTLWNDATGVQVGSASSPVPLNQWFMVNLRWRIVAAGNDTIEGRLNGISFASSNTEAISTVAGAKTIVGNVSMTLYSDDLAINNDTDVNETSWPNDSGKIVLLIPVSDNGRAALWTGGAGGTTNLFDAVNNLPPIGTASATNLTQIKHGGNAATATDRYDANMTTYLDAGIGANDTVTVIEHFIVDGEAVATGTKLVGTLLVDNPPVTGSNFTAGNDAGALGTFPTNWAYHKNVNISYNPTLTLSSSPIMGVIRPETTARVVHVCIMGMWVEYVTVTPPALDDSPELIYAIVDY